MKKGKLSEISYKRSVLKKLTDKCEGTRPGVYASPMNLEDVTLVMSSNCILKWFDGCEEYYLQKTINQLCEKGAFPKYVQLNINIPENFEEKILGRAIKSFDDACKKHNISISQCNVYAGNVTDMVINITVLGNTKYTLDSKNIKPDMEVVMTSSIAIGGTSILAKMYESKLRDKFAGSFVDDCINLGQYISVENAAKISADNGAIYLHAITDGGAFSAIWELASVRDLGISVNIKDIPVWQETIEVSEVLDINPYLLDGTGSLLIVCEDGIKMVDELEKSGIIAKVIGVITDSKDRVAINGEEVRFLEPPRGDEIYKFI